MKKQIIGYFQEQIEFHENTIASEGFEDTEESRCAKQDIKELKKFIKWVEKK